MKLSIITNQTMSSREIAELTGKQVKHIHEKINQLISLLSKDGRAYDHEQYQEVKDKRGYVHEYLLNRTMTLTIVSEYSMELRYRVITRWEELEKLESARNEGNKEWDKVRAKGKYDRIAETDQIQLFIAYAKGQGGTPSGCDRYYSNITRMCNATLFDMQGKSDNWRDEMSHEQLNYIATADRIIQKGLKEGMALSLSYKEIYQRVKASLIALAQLVGVTELLTQEAKNLLENK